MHPPPLSRSMHTPAPPVPYPLSLHDALPICRGEEEPREEVFRAEADRGTTCGEARSGPERTVRGPGHRLRGSDVCDLRVHRVEAHRIEAHRVEAERWRSRRAVSDIRHHLVAAGDGLPGAGAARDER